MSCIDALTFSAKITEHRKVAEFLNKSLYHDYCIGYSITSTEHICSLKLLNTINDKATLCSKKNQLINTYVNKVCL